MNLKAFSHSVLITRVQACYRKPVRFLLLAMAIIAPPSASLAGDLDWSSLNLTPQQEVQIQRLESAWAKNHAEVVAQIMRDTAELRSLLPTGEAQRIRELQGRITTNKMYLMNESMNTFLQKREMLTPPQRAQLQKIIPSASHSNPTP